VETKNPKILGITRYFGILGEGAGSRIYMMISVVRSYRFISDGSWVIPINNADIERELVPENCISQKKAAD
jgi:hypothetical protein